MSVLAVRDPEGVLAVRVKGAPIYAVAFSYFLFFKALCSFIYS